MKEINIQILNNGNSVVDFGGDFDGSCCGCPANTLNDHLAELGIEVELKAIHCHLSLQDRIKARVTGLCRGEDKIVAKQYINKIVGMTKFGGK